MLISSPVAVFWTYWMAPVLLPLVILWFLGWTVAYVRKVVVPSHRSHGRPSDPAGPHRPPGTPA